MKWAFLAEGGSLHELPLTPVWNIVSSTLPRIATCVLVFTQSSCVSEVKLAHRFCGVAEVYLMGLQVS